MSRIQLLIIASIAAQLVACGSPSKLSQPSTSQKSTPPAEIPSPAVTAPAKVEASTEALECIRGPERRIIEIKSILPLGCELWYSRLEVKNVVASSKKGLRHCEQVRDRIQKKLENAQFTCAKKS